MIEIKIFAQYGTRNRIAMPIRKGENIKNLLVALNGRFGGSWVLVDDIKHGDIIPFQSKHKYLGFNGGSDYCQLENIFDPL
jgi:hypothetical protein